ncbi:MAG: acyl-CoA dehydrogenase family protein [Bacteroidetes bacterium]|nr:acyl-CoA dehydrogenase family protein [Bacteroidota bacterium]
MKDYFFSEDHQLFRQSLRSFLEKEALPFIDQWEEDGEIPRHLWKKFGEMGYFGLDQKEIYGGLDLDFFYTVVFLEEISKCNSGGFGAAITAHPLLTLSHLAHNGSDYLKEKYLIPGIKGEKFGCLAITEPHAGSDVAGVQTKAEDQGDHFLVNGSKTFITNGVLSDYLIAVCKTKPEVGSAGISLLVLDRDMPGITATKLKKLGWKASDTGQIHFDNVKVPKEHLIGQQNAGFYYIMQRFELERLVLAISSNAASQAAMDYTLAYMAERKAFGRSINKFQVLRHRMAQLSAEIEMNKIFTYQCCQMYQDDQYQVTKAAMAKLLATELADKVATECLQSFGGYGFMEDYKMARMFRDARLGTIGGGTSEIMREIISKDIIDGVNYSLLNKMR